MITTLVENLVYTKRLIGEHGLALHMDVDGLQLLFDTAQTGSLLQNARELGIDLSAIDHCIISHGHYDHTGGLSAVLALNPNMKLWLHRQAGIPRFNSRQEYVGMASPQLTDKAISVDRVTPISEGIYILPAPAIRYPQDQHMAGFTMEQDNTRVPDSFADEQSLVLVRNGALQIVSGCSHRGITNIIQSAVDHFQLPVDLVVGGFHLRHEQDIRGIAGIIDSFGIRRIGVSHCTGIQQYAQLQRLVQADVFYNHTATRIPL